MMNSVALAFKNIICVIKQTSEEIDSFVDPIYDAMEILAQMAANTEIASLEEAKIAYPPLKYKPCPGSDYKQRLRTNESSRKYARRVMRKYDRYITK